MNACRILPFEQGDGPTHMAIDEALLDSVASQPLAAVFRAYRWSVPTLSLGYFQRFAEVESENRWAGVPVVRRPTGGGALWHDREITYAVVVPATHPLARPSTALYRAIHAAICDRLQSLGISAQRRGARDSTIQSARQRPFLCFGDKDADDVVVGSVKLVGSAQRRRFGAVLQHGSLILARSPITPELSGLRELQLAADARVTQPAFSEDLDSWAKIFREIIPEVLGGDMLEQNYTEGERLRADLLQRTVYGNPDWNRRR